MDNDRGFLFFGLLLIALMVAVGLGISYQKGDLKSPSCKWQVLK